MTLKDKLKTATMVGAMAVAPLAHGQNSETEAPEPTPITQSAQPTQNERDADYYINLLKQNQPITYDGLTFDTPKLRQIQQKLRDPNAPDDRWPITKFFSAVTEKVTPGTTSMLKNFDFIMDKGNYGFSINNPDNPLEKYQYTMTREDFGGMFNMILSKINNDDAAYTTSDDTRPSNPHQWKYDGPILGFVMKSPKGERPMNDEELGKMFDYSLDMIFALDKNGIIDLDKIIDKYTDNIKSFAAGATLYGIYKGSKPALQQFVSRTYKNTLIKFINFMRADKAAFDTEKQQAIVRYDAQQEAIRKQQEQEIARQRQEQEAKRIASLRNIQGPVSDVKIEKQTDAQNKVVVCNLSCKVGETDISIEHYKGSNNMAAQTWDKQDGVKFLQPEEFQSVYKSLMKGLNESQKNELGRDFMQKMAKEANPNMDQQIALKRLADSKHSI